MAANPDPMALMALMAQTYQLPRGPRVRLRLATPRDEQSIRALIERNQADPPPIDVARLIRFDPRDRAVICATALLNGAETVVGVGSITSSAGRLELLLVDRQLTDGLGELLRRALEARAGALRRDPAA